MSEQLLTYKDFWGSIEISVEDNCLYGQLLFLEDTISYEAMSVRELQTAFEEAVDDYLTTCQELGRPVPRPFQGSLLIQIGPDLHCQIAIRARQERLSMDDFVRKSLEQVLTVPGIRTAKSENPRRLE
jgi:predicted HicB family RNase H-like nuclease